MGYIHLRTAMTNDKKLTYLEGMPKEEILKVCEGLKSEIDQILKEKLELEADKKKLLLEVKKSTRYGLNWDQATAPDESLKIIKENFPLFKHVPEKQIGEGKNLLIEGDNLVVLSNLSVLMPGQVNVSSIDPPYNTGSGFRYTDIFGNVHNVTLEDPYKGTKWLNMMFPRLYLGLILLAETGVMFIHIDEHERADLELLCKMIFPKFEGELIWVKNTQKNNAKGVSVTHEHILIVANSGFQDFALVEKPNYQKIQKKLKSMLDLKGKRIIHPNVAEEISKSFPKIKKKDLEKMFPDFVVEMTEDVIQQVFSRWMETQNFSGGEAPYNMIDFEKKDLYSSDNLSAPANAGAKYDIEHPVTKKPCKIPAGGWRMSQETSKEWIAQGEILFGPDETTVPRKKRFFKDNSKERLKSVIYESRNGSSDLQLLGFDSKTFDYPKPVVLIKHYLRAALGKSGLCLDFFAGSGTVGQAIVELNHEDDGSRLFILVTNNENNICEEVTYERMRRVMTGTEKYEARPDKGLAYFKVELVPRHKNTEQFKHDLSLRVVDSIKALEKAYEESKLGDGNVVLESREKVVIWQAGLDLDVIEAFILKAKKEVVLYLTDFEGSDLSEEVFKKVSRLEQGLLSKIAKSDFSKIM